MRLTAGTRLGPYEIVAPLGAGGMGEVYKALDTRLDRAVAVKVLSSVTSASPEARERFEREARTISQLSHPHICALFDVGEATLQPPAPSSQPPTASPQPLQFLVMELLDGETLAQRLASGPLPLDLTLRYAAQIADALDKAHRQGIVHRDLKPANVMITKTGVKLLDFGLAKALAPSSVNVVETMPRVQPITATGAIAGTVQYMAPEQLAGLPADARSDIYAFGAVVYEMATGQRVFGAARLTVSPAPLDHLVRVCLAAEPDERWQSAHDVRLQLDAMRAHALDAAPSAGSRLRQWLPWAIAVPAILIAAFAIMRGTTQAPPPTAPPARFAIPPPAGGAFVSHVETLSMALSPDGSQLAFVASDANSGPRIWLRRLASLEAAPIAGTEGNEFMSLFWSPDGRSLGFFTDGKLKRVDLQGGGTVTVCPVPEDIGLYGTWGRDGRILFTSVEGAAIYQVAIGGGTPTPLLAPDRAVGEVRLTWPSFLPDGERFLYTVRLVDGGARVMLGAPGKAPRQVLTAVSNVQYADPGYLVFGSEGTLVAQRFDVDAARVVGDPFAIAQPVRYFYSTAATMFTVSRSGTLAYQSHDDESRLVRYARSGAEVGTVGPSGVLQNLRVSPDGSAIVFARGRGGSYDLWRGDLARGVESVLTSDPGSEFAGVWHPDGRTVFFAADRKGPPHLFRKDLKTGAESEVFQSTRFQQPEDVSPDGQTLLYGERSVSGAIDLWTVPVPGGAPSRVFDSPFHEWGGRFSRDGRWLSYVSAESGRNEAYISPFPATGEKTQVSTTGASAPRWSRDGRELFYVSPQLQLVAVPVRTAPSLHIGVPATLFTLPGLAWRDFDVLADGGQFVAHVPQTAGNRQPLTAVLNWMTDPNIGTGNPIRVKTP